MLLRRPLRCAVANGATACVTLLLAAGADARCRTHHGRTATQLTRNDDDNDVLALLLEDAADAAARWSGLRQAALTAWRRPGPPR